MMQQISSMTVTLINRSVRNDTLFKRVIDTLQSLIEDTEEDNGEPTQEEGGASNYEGTVLITDGETTSAAKSRTCP
ncbi:hypothetical protein LINPERPRIM_LOCUS2177, partial [Linum perenne]